MIGLPSFVVRPTYMRLFLRFSNLPSRLASVSEHVAEAEGVRQVLKRFHVTLVGLHPGLQPNALQCGDRFRDGGKSPTTTGRTPP